MDPTLGDVKRLCLSLRKLAGDDRVLLHYNGHGVPKPSSSGEIWVTTTPTTPPHYLFFTAFLSLLGFKWLSGCYTNKVFNKNYTQYIPLSVYDLQTWLQAPSIIVLDCSTAGGVSKANGRVERERSERLDSVFASFYPLLSPLRAAQIIFSPFLPISSFARLSPNNFRSLRLTSK